MRASRVIPDERPYHVLATTNEPAAGTRDLLPRFLEAPRPKPVAMQAAPQGQLSEKELTFQALKGRPAK